ncbi:MAG: hypothetical protein KJ011_21060 [Burkholderiaceae bacterium]|nr:hypothetical protein [Burkholderiaceae bacterium]
MAATSAMFTSSEGARLAKPGFWSGWYSSTRVTVSWRLPTWTRAPTSMPSLPSRPGSAQASPLAGMAVATVAAPNICVEIRISPRSG